MWSAAVEDRWRELAEDAIVGTKEWRPQHPKATFKEIETALDDRLAKVRARMLEDTALASGVSDIGGASQEERPKLLSSGFVAHIRHPRTGLRRLSRLAHSVASDPRHEAGLRRPRACGSVSKDCAFWRRSSDPGRSHHLRLPPKESVSKRRAASRSRSVSQPARGSTYETSRLDMGVEETGRDWPAKVAGAVFDPVASAFSIQIWRRRWCPLLFLLPSRGDYPLIQSRTAV